MPPLSDHVSGQEGNPSVEAAMHLLQEAFKALTSEERGIVKEIQAEVDEAARAGAIPDPRLEFCYTVKFSKDRLDNSRLLRACEAYITAVEG